ncbi:hypothetical protein ACFFQW_49640 [Umezawaea endophytica]|uniref:Uncharacterized protein n=1 Tax=Umezawaea endophytica TaxID=1654476 RepID=A0A9X2VUQ1_9PSEU|nr:hypothetical protein [Umezawaea endophytica]MCS7482697.1 hypothetical protein [Umezawaea endophytica]
MIAESRGPLLSRRRVLLAAASAPLAVACTTPPPAPLPPDPLADLAVQARADAALATAAGLEEVAAARTEHAKLIQAEVDRARPSGPSSSASAPPGTSAAPPPSSGTPEQVVEALQAAQKAGTELLATVPPHRAGLLGSVVAGCASLVEVMS